MTLGFSIVIILTIVVGAFSYTGLNSVQFHADESREFYILEESVYEAMSERKNYMIYTDDKSLENWNSIMDHIYEHIDELKIKLGKDNRDIDLDALKLDADKYKNAFLHYVKSREDEKVIASRERILQTARVAHAFSGDGIVFHPAFYMKQAPEKVYEKVKRHLTEIIEQLEKEGKRVWLRPELMGKASQFGTLNEILRLCAEVQGLAPCLDFAHLHARTGNFNTYKEFSQVMTQIGEKLGCDAKTVDNALQRVKRKVGGHLDERAVIH